MEYELVEAILFDVDSVVDIIQLGKVEDSLQEPTTRNATYENLLPHLLNILDRNLTELATRLKVLEVATRLIVG
ncbi:hypothetical protein AOQ84DRAFT_226896 [Glonium stellatum]|uniref:Uncharacterized protein n=1 Tax=Glonium stellatum TaxID=574774 RepID=A0A8E2ES10_9PEZI|nr:hypothetical protein AOQ84DRAFT_226896 [Glonium stellatum]